MHHRLIQNRNVWNNNRTWKGTSLLGYSPWRADLLAVASKHCSLLHNRSPWRTGAEQTLLSVTYSSPWQADYSRWRTWQVFCREVRLLTPKTQFSSTPIPNLIENSTYDRSTTWTSIIYEFYGHSTLLKTNSTCSIIKYGFKS